jgi:hypothetical protein
MFLIFIIDISFCTYSDYLSPLSHATFTCRTLSYRVPNCHTFHLQCIALYKKYKYCNIIQRWQLMLGDKGESWDWIDCVKVKDISLLAVRLAALAEPMELATARWHWFRLTRMTIHRKCPSRTVGGTWVEPSGTFWRGQSWWGKARIPG